MHESAKPQLSITTFRKGMLSRLGHDLRLQLSAFEFELREGTLTGRFELQTLRVIGAVENGRVHTDVPSASDRSQIERTIAELLKIDAHPKATLTGQVRETIKGTRWSFSGTLSLAGQQAPLEAEVERRADVLTAGLDLIPSRFGIPPYKALGGALRLEDRVRVEVQLPATAAQQGSDLTASGTWTSA